jgi:hypothetical protein
VQQSRNAGELEHIIFVLLARTKNENPTIKIELSTKTLHDPVFVRALLVL